MAVSSTPTLGALALELAAGAVSSRALVEACLENIQAASGEGGRAFIQFDEAQARVAADAMDALRKANAAPSPYAGIPISIKDLFDVRGQVTKAGSTVLAGIAPATEDAPSVSRLRQAGFIFIGRTNMTEFAYSGLGLNPHYGTPLSPWNRLERRVAGGSSSGAAVSVCDGMAHAALGTDTGGSCRIPAAFTRLAGYKPTARRIPLEGAVPLSRSLDSVGSIARSVDCCRILDSILAGECVEGQETFETPSTDLPLTSFRLAVPTTAVLNDLDETVGAVFERALSRLSECGARLEHIAFPEFSEVLTINARGGLTAAESYAWHRAFLAKGRAQYDPRVAVRIERGEALSAADYIGLLDARRNLIKRATARLSSYTALLMPTVPVVPPRVAELEADDTIFAKTNILVLRNSTMINMIDGCAVSLPIANEDEPPVGLTVAKQVGADQALFGVAAAIEGALKNYDS